MCTVIKYIYLIDHLFTNIGGLKNMKKITFVIVIFIILFSNIGAAGSNGCGDEGCHEKEYKQLTDSMHSKSWNEPLFQSFYQRAIDEIGEK